jgi:hypothetical protein
VLRGIKLAIEIMVNIEAAKLVIDPLADLGKLGDVEQSDQVGGGSLRDGARADL